MKSHRLSGVRRRSFLVASVGTIVAGRVLAESVDREIKVTLREAHKGTLEIDTRLLDSYGAPPPAHRQFYFEAREWFVGNRDADFSDDAVVLAAQKHGLALMGGPMLGDVTENSVTVWLRPAITTPMEIVVAGRTIPIQVDRPGEAIRVKLDGLSPKNDYAYSLRCEDKEITSGSFKTTARPGDSGQLRIAFGSCFHKIGLHNPNLFQTILNRSPHAMMLLGDLAVDDRNDQINLHRADYQLRDVSPAWRSFVAQMPVFTAWDDHDYFDNDLSGVPRRFKPTDRDAVRAVWRQNWNNPATESERQGIYFNTRLGPAEIIMLDTRSCRDNRRRHEYGSYLGDDQLQWLKRVLSESTAEFKIVSSGTMWSDYVSKAKDSWGSWDTQAREEIFQLIEDEKIGGVLLVSGDRHGARGFRIPRPSGYSFYEFEPATLGGVSGPAGKVKGCSEQLFGYSGSDENGDDFIAFGEFTFDTSASEPGVTFRLISQFGDVLEQITLTSSQLAPGA